MYIFLKKGSVLVLITLGILLSLLGPSHALKCYECSGIACDTGEMKEVECPAGVNCVRRKVPDYGASFEHGTPWIHKAACAEEHPDGNGLGCSSANHACIGCLSCNCDTDLCNTKDIVTSEGGGGRPVTENEGGSSAAPKPALLEPILRFCILTLSALLLIG